MSERPDPSLLPRPVQRKESLSFRSRLLFILLMVIAMITIYNEAMEGVRNQGDRVAYWILNSEPEGVNVYTPDEKLLGKTPIQIKRQPGTRYHVFLEAAGYERKKVEMDFPETQLSVPRQTVTLAAVGTRVDLSKLPADSTYSIDGGPESFVHDTLIIPVTPGEHTLTVRMRGQQPITMQIFLRDDEVFEANAALATMGEELQKNSPPEAGGR